MNDANEKWLSIPGYEGFYEISNLGQVRSLERTETIGDGITRLRAAKVMRPDNGRVRLLRDGTYKSASIQGLVETLFPETANVALDEPGEQWLPVPGYENMYEVSNHYRVRSLGRTTTHGREDVSRKVRAKFLSVYRNNGYLVAHLSGDKTRPQKKLYVEAMAEHLFPDGTNPETFDEIVSEPGEEWRQIAEYEGLYEVSNLGRVKSTGWYVNGVKRRYARPRLRVLGVSTVGYPKVELAKDGAIKTLAIHRLVAMAFIPNPLGLPVVHHKDENRTNNRADNLEWVTNEDNIRDWFDRRRIVIDAAIVEMIGRAWVAGKSPAEILAALPRRQKAKK